MNRLSKGVAYAIGAALLFGISTPAAKPLLAGASAQLIAGLLYLGSAIGLAIVLLARTRSTPQTARLAGKDWLWLAAATLFGGILGPLLLMIGLSRTNAATASLLLNFEGVATALIAWIVLREHASLRTIAGMVFIVLGGVALTWNPAPAADALTGPLAIIGACVAWAIDNNVTRNISASDAVTIATIKSAVAGIVNTSLALALAHSGLPSAGTIGAALIVGFLGYGVSLVLYILAQRDLGAARTGSYFSTAPFIGAVAAVVSGSTPFDSGFIVAGLCMTVGVWLHLTERHQHEHAHEFLEHEHAHVHDEHHQHEHDPSDPPGEPHVHKHRHESLVHSHAHFPDIHHRHSHEP